ncbi:MAG: acyltransferase family protein, partial [Cytophagales bacterium]|nr:acyltransferase family protein [Rhizobacter sp.]
MSGGLDLLRHLFCVAVIVQHMASASRYSLHTNQGLASVISWVDGAVLGFFFISGFLFKDPENLQVYAKRQALRLLLPFFIFSLLYAVALAVVGKAELASSLASTLILQGSGMQLYFLPYLLLVSLLYAACKQMRGARGVLLLAAFCLSLFMPTATPSGPDPKLLPLYMCAYSLGALVGQLALRERGTEALLCLVLVCLGVGLLDYRF